MYSINDLSSSYRLIYYKACTYLWRLYDNSNGLLHHDLHFFLHEH